MADAQAAGEGEIPTFQDMRSQIEEKIDDLIFKSFKIKNYDPKEA